ncbi:juvenile hormone acid O-methyltransferase [Trichonephila clavipes]|nr:juvenile hormone acid O-methyltransferase [Trichonephila clavipes]
MASGSRSHGFCIPGRNCIRTMEAQTWSEVFFRGTVWCVYQPPSMQFGTQSCWVIISTCLCCCVILTVMEFSSKELYPLQVPVGYWLVVLEQDGKGHHKAPMNLTELWTALANIWPFIPVERFQKLVELWQAVIKTRGGPTRY